MNLCGEQGEDLSSLESPFLDSLVWLVDVFGVCMKSACNHCWQIVALLNHGMLIDGERAVVCRCECQIQADVLDIWAGC
jgi:hypothetical protein